MQESIVQREYGCSIVQVSNQKGIRGNIGDQWSDLLEDCVGDHTFKLPNPMYFIPWKQFYSTFVFCFKKNKINISILELSLVFIVLWNLTTSNSKSI